MCLVIGCPLDKFSRQFFSFFFFFFFGPCVKLRAKRMYFISYDSAGEGATFRVEVPHGYYFWLASFILIENGTKKRALVLTL